MIIFVYKALLAIALNDGKRRSQVDWDFPVTVWGVVMMSCNRHRNWLGWLKSRVVIVKALLSLRSSVLVSGICAIAKLVSYQNETALPSPCGRGEQEASLTYSPSLLLGEGE